MSILIFSLFLFTFLYSRQESKFSIREHLILDELMNKGVEILSQSFNNINPLKTIDKNDNEIEGIGILPFKGDLEGKFYRRMKKEFTRTRFKVYEKEELDHLLNEQRIQQQDFYSKEGRLKIGQLTQWKGIIFGEINAYIENLLGKRKIYLEIELSFDNLETGQIVWSEHYTDYEKVKININYFIYGMLLLFISIFSINGITHGHYTTKVFGIGFFAILAWIVWFFVI